MKYLLKYIKIENPDREDIKLTDTGFKYDFAIRHVNTFNLLVKKILSDIFSGDKGKEEHVTLLSMVVLAILLDNPKTYYKPLMDELRLKEIYGHLEPLYMQLLDATKGSSFRSIFEDKNKFKSIIDNMVIDPDYTKNTVVKYNNYKMINDKLNII